MNLAKTWQKSVQLALAGVVICTTSVQSAWAATIDTAAKQAIVVDVQTDTVLLSKEAFQPMYPASMTKLMTAHIVFDQLAEGKLKLDDTFRVSEKAWRKGGSKMFVKVGDEVSVKDLLMGIIVQSGNDACIVVAEGIAGSEEQFAQLMNQKAKELGLRNSHFKNSTGWPDDEHVMSPFDLYKLAYSSITKHPDYYPYYAEKEFTYSGITQPNRNLLLGENGVDGLKTGHTEASGYGITVSGVNPDDNRRIIVVVNGLNSNAERLGEAEKLLEWAYRNFENRTLWTAGQPVAQLPVWFGEKETVSAVPSSDIYIALPKGGDGVTATLDFHDPLPSPLAKGTPVAILKLNVPGREAQQIELVAGEDVGKLSGFGRIGPAMRHFLF